MRLPLLDSPLPELQRNVIIKLTYETQFVALICRWRKNTHWEKKKKLNLKLFSFPALTSLHLLYQIYIALLFIYIYIYIYHKLEPMWNLLLFIRMKLKWKIEKHVLSVYHNYQTLFAKRNVLWMSRKCIWFIVLFYRDHPLIFAWRFKG